MKQLVFALAIAMMVGTHAFAAEVADSVDSTAQVSDAKDADAGQGAAQNVHAKKARKATFGASVSAEAHKLKAEGQNGKKNMGAWVSDQRRQDDSKSDVRGGMEDHSSISESRRK